MKLLTYNNIKEKEKLFENRYKCVDTWSDLKSYLDKYENSSDVIFRGMSEAKYKNYTSLQRYYITHDWELCGLTLSQILTKEINEICSVHDGLLNTYLKSIGIEPNWFLWNSYLQHYGGVTPLLDFSKSFLKAMFFMQDGAIVSPSGSEDIDNYCSLYFIEQKDTEAINTLIEDTAKKLHENYKKIKEKYASIFNLSKDCLRNMSDQISRLIDAFFTENFYNSFEDLIEGFNNSCDVVLFLSGNDLLLDCCEHAKHKHVVMTTNLNSIAQESVFMLVFGLNPLENDSVHCIDIHKSLLPSIRKCLKCKNITENTIYPKVQRITTEVLNKIEVDIFS